jgi:hypothetical protein
MRSEEGRKLEGPRRALRFTVVEAVNWPPEVQGRCNRSNIIYRQAAGQGWAHRALLEEVNVQNLSQGAEVVVTCQTG